MFCVVRYSRRESRSVGWIPVFWARTAALVGASLFSNRVWKMLWSWATRAVMRGRGYTASVSVLGGPESFSLTYGVDQSLERLEGLLQRDGGLAGQRDDLLSVGREGLGVGDQSAQLFEQDGGLGCDLPVGHGGMSTTG
jgi:hypothetical protein